jgi:hypothetical protein
MEKQGTGKTKSWRPLLTGGAAKYLPFSSHFKLSRSCVALRSRLSVMDFTPAVNVVRARRGF